MAEDHEIGAYEAKSKLPEFLRKVAAGERFTITQRGRPVAELVPWGTATSEDTAAAARRMRAFIDNRRPKGRIDTKALTEEGRD